MDANMFDEVRGDVDTAIVSYAFEKILTKNKDRGKTNVWGAQGNVFSRYFLDSDATTAYANYNDSWVENYPDLKLSKAAYREKLLACWEKYKNEEISNIVVILHAGDDYKTGRMDSHAYAIRDIATGPDGKEYIELINPWDDRDCVRFDLDTFFTWNTEFQVYGVDLEEGVHWTW